jgi:hypothetical protein
MGASNRGERRTFANLSNTFTQKAMANHVKNLLHQLKRDSTAPRWQTGNEPQNKWIVQCHPLIVDGCFAHPRHKEIP